MASGNLQEKEFYLLNSYTLLSCILRKIIISTSPWQPGSKNSKKMSYFTYHISDDKRLLPQTFPGTFEPKLKLV